jgi:hypothetical protein
LAISRLSNSNSNSVDAKLNRRLIFLWWLDAEKL